MTNDVRLAVFAPTPSGGHPEYVRKLVAGLQNAGIADICWPIRPDFAEDNRQSGVDYPVTIPRMPERARIGTVRWLAARLNKSKRHDAAFLRTLRTADRTHVLIEEVQQLRTHWLVRQVKARGCKAILHLHNVRRHDYKGSLLDRLVERDLRRACREADVVVLHTEGAARTLMQRHGQNIRTLVIPHGTTPKVTSPTVPEPLTEVLFYGVNRPNKGLPFLVESMNLITDRELSLVVAGSTPADYLERTNKILGESRHEVVWMNDFVSAEQTIELMRSAGVVALPYRSFEAQSGVLHLAMEYAVPVVATDQGGIGETIRSHSNGIVVPPNDCRSFASALVEALNPRRNGELRDMAVRAAAGQTWEVAGMALASAMRHTEWNGVLT